MRYFRTLLPFLLAAGCGGGGQPAPPFSANPVPVLQAVSPATGLQGSSDLTLTLTGSGFTPQSEVTADGTALATSFVSVGELTAVLPAGFLSQPGAFAVAVRTSPPGGGASAAKTFTVMAAGVVSATNHPQVAAYSITIPRDATVSVEFGVPGNQDRRTGSRPTPPGGGEVSLLVAGMRAFTTYTLRGVVEFPEGIIHLDGDHEFTTGGLPPEQLPALTVTRPPGFTAEPGVQLLNLIRGAPKVRALVTDLDGAVIWFYDGLASTPFPLKFLQNGNVLVVDTQPAPAFLREIDLAGNTLREITPAELNDALVAAGLEPVAGAFHHDFAELPNGHLLLLTSYTQPFTDVAGFEGQTIEVLGDALVELNANWEPVWTWSAFDHLDVNRHPLGFPDGVGRFDWTHGNAVVYSPADGNLLLSLRNQHWVLKIDYRDGLGTGQVLWRLGHQGDFELQDAGPEGWQYAQHFPVILDPQQVAVYRLAVWDNGNDRVVNPLGEVCDPAAVTPPVLDQRRSPRAATGKNDLLLSEPAITSNQAVVAAGVACYSRAVIFEIDENLRTARILWEDPLDFFSPFLGSIQVFDGGDGHVLWNAGTLGVGRQFIVREVTQDPDPATVWEMKQSDDQFSYRSLRLPSLYPGVEW